MMRALRWLYPLILIPAIAAGQAVIRITAPAPEVPLWSVFLNGTMLGTSFTGGYVLPASHGFTVQAWTTQIAVASGGGAGNTVIRVTDGTRNCDCTLACTDSASTGAKRVACSGSCVFPAAAALTSSITTGACTTSQPNVKNIQFIGNWN